MKKNKALVLAVLLAVAGIVIYAALRTDNGGHRGVSNAAPPIHVVDVISGRGVTPEELQGKVVFLNIWASWCQPCKEEMPSIEALYRGMSYADGFRMITVLYKDTPEPALSYMKSMGYTFPVYTDPEGTTARDYGVTGVPETYIIDKKGVLAKRVIGGMDWSSPEAKDFLQTLLKQ